MPTTAITGTAMTAMRGATPPRAFVKKRVNMRVHPKVVETVYQRKFLHMGVPPLRKRVGWAGNLGEVASICPETGCDRLSNGYLPTHAQNRGSFARCPGTGQSLANCRLGIAARGSL